MNNLITTTVLVLVLYAGVTVVSYAGQSDITIQEFRQIYDNLLAGKTLVSESKRDGITLRTERRFGEAIDVGEDSFEVPVQRVVTQMKGGELVQKTTVHIIDKVNDLGGTVIIYEEARRVHVETLGAEPLSTRDIEFLGLFRASKNDKGGFDVHNFGLVPSVVVEDDQHKIAGTNVSYSCYPEGGKSKCVLTVRDYKLNDYEPLVGYRLGDAIGGDYVEISEETQQ